MKSVKYLNCVVRADMEESGVEPLFFIDADNLFPLYGLFTSTQS